MGNLQEYKCPCCGGAIEFNSKLQKMKCPYCDTEFEIETLQGYEKELQNEQSDDMTWETSAGSECWKFTMSCLSSFFFFIKTYLWDSFFLGKTNIGTCFFLPKKQCFFSCLLVGKVLPSHWQGFATALAKLCHRHGKSLPRARQVVGKISC